MNIDILYTDDCPNYPATVKMVNEVVAELTIDANIRAILVRGPAEATVLHFLGSPSVQVNSVDIEPKAHERTDYAYACRTYGGAGVPSREMLVAALQDDGADDSIVESDTPSA